MSDIPFDVMMRGPAAVAGWLASERAETQRRSKRMAGYELAILAACNINPAGTITAEDVSLAIGACAQVAVMLAYTAKDAMRGPARDALAEIIDACFDVVDSVEENGTPDLRDAIQKLRAVKR